MFITDRSSNLTAHLMREVCCMLNINKVCTLLNHPQSDGIAERVNGIIVQLLEMYKISRQRDWNVFLLAVVYAYNTSISGTTGEILFFLKDGKEPVLILDTTMLPPPNLSQSLNCHQQQMMAQIRLVREMAREHTQRTQTKTRQSYDQHSKDHSFKVSHWLWIYSPAVKFGLSKKLACIWHRQITTTSFKVANCRNSTCLQNEALLPW